jgi:PTS system nitrogen regulatory IIA component
MDARDVRRLADRGELPGQRVGVEWRFNRAEMLDYLQHAMHDLDPEHIRNLERATAEEPDETLIQTLLPLEAVELNLAARSRSSVLRELVNLAERTGLVYDHGQIVDLLLEREELRSTALPGGLAFPHPRRPLPYATAQPLLCLARVPSGVPFNAPDGRLTDLFVLVLSHDDRQHLHTLARLSRVFAGELTEQLRGAEDAADALRLICAAEREMLEASTAAE